MLCDVFLCNVLFYCYMTCSFVMYIWCDEVLCDVLLCDEFLMWCNVLSRIVVQRIVM